MTHKRRWACRFGFHVEEPVSRLITISRTRCIHCGGEWVHHLFGSMKVDPSPPRNDPNHH